MLSLQCWFVRRDYCKCIGELLVHVTPPVSFALSWINKMIIKKNWPGVEVPRDHDIHPGIRHGQEAPQHPKFGRKIIEARQICYRADVEPGHGTLSVWQKDYLEKKVTTPTYTLTFHLLLIVNSEIAENNVHHIGFCSLAFYLLIQKNWPSYHWHQWNRTDVESVRKGWKKIEVFRITVEAAESR
jgi:hypothetical protein